MTYALAILCCWAISFCFAGIEAGLLAIDPVRLRHHAKQQKPSAIRLERLMKHPERLLITVLLITNMADILGLLLLTQLLVSLLGNAGYLAAVFIALPIYLLVLALLPKSLFRRFPFRALAALAGLLNFISVILWPILEIGKRIGGLLIPQARSGGARLFIAREELKQIAVQSEREGSLTSTERAMIHNVVDFRNVKASDVMVPLEKATSISPDVSMNQALTLGGTSAGDRLPVISPNGEAIGIVNVLDILLDPARGKSLSNYTRRMVSVTENEPAYRVMQRLRAARLGLAAVLNKDQKPIGIVTGEDIIKRLVQIGAV
jgi:putative hemolysin